jgi:hypothetical protein
MTYEPHYEGSSVVMGQPGAVCSAHGTHTYEARIGHHLPPRKLSSGQSTFQALGRGFTLFAFGAGERDGAALEQAAASLKVPFKVVTDTLADERKDYGARFVLVRPDQYVVWSGNEPPRDPQGLLRRVTGRGAA